MSMIAVSGASGFLGRHLCPELVAGGHRVVEISRAALGAADLHCSLAGADVVIHLAARAHVIKETSPDPREEFWSSNIRLTESVGRAARLAGVQRFVFLSSAGVLGASSPPPDSTTTLFRVRTMRIPNRNSTPKHGCTKSWALRWSSQSCAHP